MKRRWKLLIAALTIGLSVSGWQWWNAPRLDPRLVGNWTTESFSPVVADGRSSPEIYLDLNLEADGSFSLEHRESGTISCGIDVYSIRTQWSVAGDKLLLSRRGVFCLGGRSASWSRWLTGLWNWASSPMLRKDFDLFYTHQKRYDIIGITPTHLWLREPADDGTSKTLKFSREEIAQVEYTDKLKEYLEKQDFLDRRASRQ